MAASLYICFDSRGVPVMVCILHTQEELLNWRRSLKPATPVMLYYYSHKLYDHWLKWTQPSIPKSYALVVLLYSETDQYTTYKKPELHKQLKDCLLSLIYLDRSNAVVFKPSKEEMTKMCNIYGTLLMSKSMYPLHRTVDHTLRLPAYVMPVLATSFLVRPQRIEWETNNQGTWFTGMNALKYLGVPLHQTWQTVKHSTNVGFLDYTWMEILWHFNRIEASKKNYYKYLRGTELIPIASFGGQLQIVSKAQLDWHQVPNIPPDHLLYSSLQHVLTLSMLQYQDIFYRARCMRHLSIQDTLSTMIQRLWSIPNIQVISCTTAIRHSCDPKKSVPITCSTMVTCKISGIIQMNAFVRNIEFPSFHNTWRLRNCIYTKSQVVLYKTKYYLA